MAKSTPDHPSLTPFLPGGDHLEDHLGYDLEYGHSNRRGCALLGIQLPLSYGSADPPTGQKGLQVVTAAGYSFSPYRRIRYN